MKHALLTTICLWAAVLASPGDAANLHTGRGFNVRLDKGVPLTACEQLHVTSRDRDVATGAKSITVGRTAAPLRVVGSRNGGVFVTGVERPDYLVRLCSFGGGGSAADARALADKVSIARSGSSLTVDGPAGDDWLAYWIIQAPRDAPLDLDVLNGPLRVTSTSGKVVARSTNGPIVLRGCSGDVQADAQNGPIDLAEGGGRIQLSTRNGPIGVTLSGRSWRGAGLDASARNGPVRLTLPDVYDSGVEVELSRHSPFRCTAAACGQALRNWDDRGRSLRFGASPAIVRLASVNGPVTIEGQ